MLVDLPEDLLLFLAQFYLEFEDLLILRQVCKRLNQLCCSRTVVLAQARQSFRRPLPLPTFRDINTLSSEELFGVLTKRTFLQRNWTSPKPKLLRSRQIHIPNHEIIALALLQGGNHVLTWLRSGKMACWDISQPDTPLCTWLAGSQALFWWYRVGAYNQTTIILETGIGRARTVDWDSNTSEWMGSTFQIISLTFNPETDYRTAQFTMISSFELYQPRVLVAFVKTCIVAALVVDPDSEVMYLYVRCWANNKQAMANLDMLWPGEAINVYNHVDADLTLYLERAGVAYTYDYSLEELFTNHGSKSPGFFSSRQVHVLRPHTSRSSPFIDNLPTTSQKESCFSYFRGLDPQPGTAPSPHGPPPGTARVALTSILNQDDPSHRNHISVAQHILQLPLPPNPIPRYHFDLFEDVTMFAQATHADIPNELRDNLPMANAWRANVVWLQYDTSVNPDDVWPSESDLEDSLLFPFPPDPPRPKCLKIATYPTVMGPRYELNEAVIDEIRAVEASSAVQDRDGAVVERGRDEGHVERNRALPLSPAFLTKHLTTTLPLPPDLDINQIMELELDDAHGLLAVSIPGGRVHFLYFA